MNIYLVDFSMRFDTFNIFARKWWSSTAVIFKDCFIAIIHYHIHYLLINTCIMLSFSNKFVSGINNNVQFIYEQATAGSFVQAKPMAGCPVTELCFEESLRTLGLPFNFKLLKLFELFVYCVTCWVSCLWWGEGCLLCYLLSILSVVWVRFFYCFLLLQNWIRCDSGKCFV